MSNTTAKQRTLSVEITSPPEPLIWLLPFFGQIWIVACGGMLIFGGVRDIIWVTPLLAATGVFIAFVDRCQVYRVAKLSDEGVALRPLWHWRFGAAPFQFSWGEVKEIRRGAFIRGGTRAARVTLDRPHTFWTLKPGGKHRVWMPDGIAKNPRFIELVRKHVPAENVCAGSLSVEPGVSRSLRVRSGAVAGISALTIAWCAVRLMLGVGGLGMPVFFLALVAIVVGGVASTALQASAPGWSSGLLWGTASAFVFVFNTVLVTVLLSGNEGILVAFMAAVAGFLFAVAFLLLRARPLRPSGAVLCYVLALIGGVVGYLGYGGVPSIRVTSGTLPLARTPWTPQGNAFLVFETTSDSSDSAESGSTMVRWYSAGLTPGHYMSLPGHPRVRCVGADAALAIIETSDEEARCELWWLPRLSGEARCLLVADSVDLFAMDLRGNTAILQVGNGERKVWQRCNLAGAELTPVDLPMQPDEVKRLWICENGTLRWLIGSVPRDEKGLGMSPSTHAANPSPFAEAGRCFEIWEWQDGADVEPKRLYQAETEWLQYHTRNREPRIYACQIKPGDRTRVEYIQVDVSADVPVVSEITEQVYKQCRWRIAEWNLTSIPQLDSSEVLQPFARVAATNTATGERKLLRNLPGFFSVSGRFWSPTAESFLYTGMKAKFRPRWRRDPESNLEFVEEVYIVNLRNH